MSSKQVKCGFCKSDSDFWRVSNVDGFFGFDCPICHSYFIKGTLYDRIKVRPIDNALLWCISENIKNNAITLPVTASWHSMHETHLPPLASDIVVRRFENYENVPIHHAQKTNELLKRIAEKIGTSAPFTWVGLDLSDLYLLKMADFKEAVTWLDELIRNRFIETNLSMGIEFKDLEASLTTEGWRHVSTLTNYLKSNTGFIAMSFGYAERNQLESTITDACSSAGWKATAIDRHEYAGGVVDAIIAKINESRFVVADLTEHKNGVYFEAGYAIGKNIPVIFTVKDEETETEKVHFDVKHLNQIRWKDYADLKLKLTNRLKAILPR